MTAGWYLKAVMFDGEDVTDSGIEFTPGRSYDGLQVVFTQKTTDLSGLVSDDRNKPVLDATVVIFPAEQRALDLHLALRAHAAARHQRPLQHQGAAAARRLPDHRGAESRAGQGSDPEFLTRAREEAKPFSLNEGETKAVDIKLSKLVP